MVRKVRITQSLNRIRIHIHRREKLIVRPTHILRIDKIREIATIIIALRYTPFIRPIFIRKYLASQTYFLVICKNTTKLAYLIPPMIQKLQERFFILLHISFSFLTLSLTKNRINSNLRISQQVIN